MSPPSAARGSVSARGNLSARRSVFEAIDQSFDQLMRLPKEPFRMVTDMLALRGLQIAGGCMSLFYHSTRSPPAMSPIAWCLLFMGVNAVNLGRLLLEEATVSFTEEELEGLFRGSLEVPRVNHRNSHRNNDDAK